ncbi:HMA2 domain-containing protein [Lamprobacter sp.]|uniref:HMA2 domain-containing protein n=1 Tax=Lamprobacter sp. TaxID=3100796 RepID=UPI003A4DFECC
MFDILTTSPGQTHLSLSSTGSALSTQLVQTLQQQTLSPAVSARARRMRVHHRVASRLRVSLPLLRGNPDLTQAFVNALDADPCIHSVRANPACGSIVIQHRLDILSEDRLLVFLSAVLEPLLGERGNQGRTQVPAQMPAQMPSAPRFTRWAVRQRPHAKPQQAERSCRGTALNRQLLTWPLADLSLGLRREPSGAAPLPNRGLPKPKPTTFAPTDRCWLCNLNQHLMQTYVRFSLKCWWQDRRRALAQRFAALMQRPSCFGLQSRC